MNVFLQLSLNEIRQLKVLVPYYNAAKTGLYAENAYGLRERARKPFWLPRAKTKMYKVAPRPVIPLEDTLELRRLHNIYHTQYRTIINFYAQELEREKQSLADATSEMSLREESHEFDRCMKENEKWNSEVALVREIRLKENDKQREEHILHMIDHLEKINAKNVQEAEEQIEKWKEISRTLITRETLDAAIEKALSTTVDFNYAIDLDGNVYHGREGGPDIEEERKESRA